jgi:hypothetical protein
VYRLRKLTFLSLLVLLLALRAHCAPALTTIQDLLYRADGSPFNGFLTIEWKSFDAGDGSKIATQNVRLRVINGLLYVRLVPTTNATPGTYYSVTYHSDGGIQFSEQWSVPPTPNVLRVRDVRVSSSPAIGSGTSTQIQISDVTGLQAELDIRPVRGGGYAPSRAAIINSLGALDAATGDLSDCVRVDGSSGPCGSAGGGAGASATFVDSETPSGAIDGLNTTFVLSQEPKPGTSLLLWRNGVLQKQGVDYDLQASVVTFLNGLAPQSGDILQASYRTSGDGAVGATTVFVDGETPSGATDGFNTSFLLSQTPNPPSSLFLYRNGLLQRNGLDYDLSGSQITFAPNAVPQSGDILLASYRMFSINSTSGQVLCGGTGSEATSTNLRSLGNCTIPGGVLRSGDRVEIHFDYEHVGSSSGFQYEIRWGASVLAARTATAAESLATGRASVSVVGSQAQWSSQNWTSTQAAAFNLGTAPESPASPITIDFLGAVANASGDRVVLRNMSVVRYPAP